MVTFTVRQFLLYFIVGFIDLRLTSNPHYKCKVPKVVGNSQDKKSKLPISGSYKKKMQTFKLQLVYIGNYIVLIKM